MENLVGITEDELSKQATTYETFPDDRNKSFFLYNVKTGLLLNVGGYWGMHVSLQEYGMRLWVFQDGDKWFHFQQNLDKDNVADGNNEGCCLEYFYDSSYSGDKATTGNGVFVDRDIYVSSTNKTIIQRGWKLEAVDDGKNTYRLYTYPRATYYTSWGKTMQLGIQIKNIISKQLQLKVTWIRTVVLSTALHPTMMLTAPSGVSFLINKFMICKVNV